jgi:uncharacterized metal-binding protein
MGSSKPLVYSCSGCSNVAQLANRIAVELNRSQVAQMSCIAGVGGDVKSLVKKAKQADSIIGIDGCPLACVKHCLQRHQLQPTHYFELSSLGHKKRYNQQCDDDEFKTAVRWIEQSLNLSDSTPTP